MQMMQTRRELLTALSLAGAANILSLRGTRAAERSLETTSVRLVKNDSICVAPAYVAEDLLRAEGFTDISYVYRADSIPPAEADFAAFFVSSVILQAAADAPFSVLTGVHVGCFELFAANDSIRSIVDLKGKRLAVGSLNGSPPHAFISVMATQVGLDPTRDIEWVITPDIAQIGQMLAEGTIDAAMGFPPIAQEWRAKKIGHVVVNSAVDRPWSDYFCCMLVGRKDYIRQYPEATKRVVRAILKAADLCATDPTAMARRLVDGGYAKQYGYTVEALSELPYDKWRDYDPEDAIRFYALRLREAGLIKATPQQIIADHTDWRFLDQLKRELKA
jgi:NitT/TauT family transport system substrate-binding protein